MDPSPLCVSCVHLTECEWLNVYVFVCAPEYVPACKAKTVKSFSFALSVVFPSLI